MTKEKALEFLQNAMSDSQKHNSVISNNKKPSIDDPRIKTLFDVHDLDKDDMLTLDDFIRFYRVKSNESPDTVWLNLAAHGYGNNLMKEVRGEVTYSNDPVVMRD